jgi:hypothetical protein
MIAKLGRAGELTSGEKPDFLKIGGGSIFTEPLMLK